jgi:histone H3/H4
MTEISLAAITRLVKNVDPRIRIGEETKLELLKATENYVTKIAETAISLAKNANRKTILPQDIETALKLRKGSL